VAIFVLEAPGFCDVDGAATGENIAAEDTLLGMDAISKDDEAISYWDACMELISSIIRVCEVNYHVDHKTSSILLAFMPLALEYGGKALTLASMPVKQQHMSPSIPTRE
jgi:hypothetical protein